MANFLHAHWMTITSLKKIEIFHSIYIPLLEMYCHVWGTKLKIHTQWLYLSYHIIIMLLFCSILIGYLNRNWDSFRLYNCLLRCLVNSTEKLCITPLALGFENPKLENRCNWRFSTHPVDDINSYQQDAACYRTQKNISRNCSEFYLYRNRGI